MNTFFGVPFYKSSIDETKFNKRKIVDLISENYSIDKNRNRWEEEDEVYGKSKLHHEYNDVRNEKFNIIDYSELINLYTEEIQKFFAEFKFNDFYEIELEVANYTCMKEIGEWMREHSHAPVHFTGIHYLQFNKEQHQPTFYKNPLSFGSVTPFFYKRFIELLPMDSRNTCWMSERFFFDIEENNFVITPGILSHYVPPMKETSDDLRIIIAVNINLLEKK